MKTPFIITNNNIHIRNGFTYKKTQFNIVLKSLRETHPNNNVFLNRSNHSMAREWAAHNLLYWIHIARAETSDVDLNYPQKWWEKVGYFVLGELALLIIK